MGPEKGFKRKRIDSNHKDARRLSTVRIPTKSKKDPQTIKKNLVVEGKRGRKTPKGLICVKFRPEINKILRYNQPNILIQQDVPDAANVPRLSRTARCTTLKRIASFKSPQKQACLENKS